MYNPKDDFFSRVNDPAEQFARAVSANYGGDDNHASDNYFAARDFYSSNFSSDSSSDYSPNSNNGGDEDW